GVERRIPASLLLIAAEVDVANMVYGTLERALGSRVFLWHEPALAPALKVLAACRFRLILLDPPLRHPGSALRAIKQVAPDVPLVLLASHANTALAVERRGLGEAQARIAGAVAVVPRSEPDPLVRVVRKVLSMPDRSGGPDPGYGEA